MTRHYSMHVHHWTSGAVREISRISPLSIADMHIKVDNVCMSALERRVQLLIDEGRYARLLHAAHSEGISVNAAIRNAVDFMYPEVDVRRQEAIAEFLSLANSPESQEVPEFDRRELETEISNDLPE